MNIPPGETAIKDIGRKAYGWILLADVAFTALLGVVGWVLHALTFELKLFLFIQFALVLALWSGYRYYEFHRRPGPRAAVAVLSDAGGLLLVVLLTVAIAQRLAGWKEIVAVGMLALVPLSLIILDALFWYALLRPGAWVSVRMQQVIEAGSRDRILPAQSPALRAIQVGSVVIGIPILLSWFLVSVEWAAARPTAPTADRAALAGEIERRQRVKQEEASNVTVALTLSGGAYRAAAFHTGVLEALEAARVPIDYLSVNSGGSIIGSYYGIGHTPDDFRRRFAQTPRFANDLFVVWEMLKDLVVPGYTSGETAARHFDRVFFAGSTFQETCHPFLLVNAVPYESGQVKTFRCPSEPGSEGMRERRVAWTVASSAAITGLFSPVDIRGARYMDGAARDNLGLEGLREYLKDNPAKPIPRILLISNATMPFQVETNPPHKIWRLLSLLRGNVTLLDEVRILLFNRYTKGRYQPGVWANQPFDPPAEDLYDLAEIYGPKLRDAGLQGPKVYVFVVSLHPTEYPRDQASQGCRTPTSVEAAARFSSIREPSPEEFDAIACVGKWLMEARVKQVRCVLEELKTGRDPLRRCRPTR